MLVLDELPLVSLLGADGQIDAARYPHFAELAGGSTWYRNATGVSGWTPVRAAGDAHRPLPGRAASPRTTRSTRTTSSPPSAACTTSRAEESITRLCPPSRCEQPASPEQGLGVLVRETGKLLGQVAAPADSRVDPEDSYREQTRAEAGLDAAEPVPADPKFRWDSLDDNQPARFTSFLAGLKPDAPGPPCTSCTC